jgi:chromosome segregation ATPase
MSEDSPRETPEEQFAREARQIADRATELREQNKANTQTWNNSGLLRDIQSRQCEVLEKMGEMKVSIDNIENHTTVMNSELGACKEDISKAKDDIKELKNRFILKLSWKQIAAIIGGTSGLIGIIFTLLKAFVFHQL